MQSALISVIPANVRGSVTIFNLDNSSHHISKATEYKMRYHTHVVVIVPHTVDVINSGFQQRTEAKDTKADPAAADSQCYEAYR